MRKEIPEWFLELKRKVWKSLSPMIGQEVTPELCEKVQKATNKIIEESPQPITVNERPINSCEIKLVNGRVNIQFY